MIGPALISFVLLLGENVPFYLKSIMNSAGFVLSSERFYTIGLIRILHSRGFWVQEEAFAKE
jgi:hypothetical protein